MRTLGLVFLVAAVGSAAPVRYELVMTVDATGALRGEATVTVTAPGDWTEVVFRLYPAAGGRERLAVTRVWAQGEEVGWESIEPTTIAVALAVTAGETFSLTLAFAGTVPEFAQGPGYGTYARSTHAVVLSQAYPILAPWDGSWVTYPVFPWGDPIVADVADYVLDLFVPAGWTVVATGTEVETSAGRYRVEGENLREMAILLLRGYECETTSVGEVKVRSFFRPAYRAAGEAALRITADAIATFAPHLGPHPFADLDVAAVPLRPVAGVEYPGLILAGESYYSGYPADSLFFPMIFAHEVAHQWWYAEVGSDQVAEPWVDEALATYTSGLYFAAQGRFPEILRYWESGYAYARAGNRSAGITSPLWEFPGGAGYGGIVYSGGALFFHAVRERMGDDAFFGALQLFREKFRWKIAPGRALLAILQTESPAPLDDLLAEWIKP